MPTPFGGWRAAAVGLAGWVAGPASLIAQLEMQHPMMQMSQALPLGIPEAREGSGTSWLPDAAPVDAVHKALGSWTLMVHGTGFFQYDWQGGSRGSDQVGSGNWAMAAARRSLGGRGGVLELRAMLSAEPWTIGRGGYPLLLQTGESYRGAPLHDRQHPHDLFMELAALYERAVTRTLAVSLYVAPVGEPAVGPVAFPHRPSAADDPLAPIAHHWQDGTHITYGVLTAGIFTRAVKLEASWFNGREPDEDRTDFDYAGRGLDSYATRVSVNPGPHWSLAGWYAYLKSPEALDPSLWLHRFGIAALTTQPLGPQGTWSSALILGANEPGTRLVAGSVLLESDLEVDETNAVFARAEYVRKSAGDLALAGLPPSSAYDVGAVVLGYRRTLRAITGLVAGVGVSGAVNFVPATLARAYGSRTPRGVTVFLRLRPRRLPSGGMAMHGMSGVAGELGD